jgi:hypothetical protein
MSIRVNSSINLSHDVIFGHGSHLAHCSSYELTTFILSYSKVLSYSGRRVFLERPEDVLAKEAAHLTQEWRNHPCQKACHL